MRFLLCLFVCFGVLFARQNYVIVDEDYSPFTGGYDLLTAFEGAMEVEDLTLILPEDSWHTYDGALARITDYIAWSFLGSVTDTVQHEVFGHGYRLRTMKGASVHGYHISLNGGYTRFELNPDRTTGAQFGLVIAGGIEAQEVMASIIRMQWISTQSIDGRMSGLYSNNQLGLLTYAYHPDSFINPYSIEQSGNDVKIYLYYLNSLFPEKTTTLTNIQKSSLVNLLDPTLWFSIISSWKYLSDARPLDLPTLTIGEVSMLPCMRTSMTPYGLEFYAQNYMSVKKAPFNAYVRWGYHVYPSFGVGGEAPHIWTIRDLVKLGLVCHAWLQPKFEKTRTLTQVAEGEPMRRPGYGSLRPGFELSFVSTIPFDSVGNVSAYCEVGGKSRGYIPGYSVHKSMILRGGLGLTF